MVTVADVRLLGGQAALDFVNTVENRATGGQELLGDYGDLLTWSRRLHLIDVGTEQELARRARRSHQVAAEVMRRAVAFREALYVVLVRVINRQSPSQAELDRVNVEIGPAYDDARLEPVRGSFVLRPPKTGLSSPLTLVARAAVSLMTSGQIERLRRCEGVGDCGWLFLDTTKNGRRRWCSMDGCGSRAKMRRQYARKRKILAESAAQHSATGIRTHQTAPLSGGSNAATS